MYLLVMKDWSADDSHSHRTGGMEYKDGKLIVPKAGTYYIYAQLHFRTPGRIQIYVNENSVSLITSPVTNKEGPAATANGIGVFELEKDDAISLRTVPYKYGAPAGSLVGFYLRYDHCYFGAFLI